MKKINKKVVCCICVLFVMWMMIFFHRFSLEERVEMVKQEAIGKQNALDYVKEKYGFDAEVKNVRCRYVNNGFFLLPTFLQSAYLTGDVYVHMKYNDIDFIVLVSGEERLSEGEDNYQRIEIQEAIKKELEIITGRGMEDLCIYYGYGHKNIFRGVDGEYRIESYYNGTNLPEIMEEECLQVAATFIDKDLSEVSKEDIEKAIGKGKYLFVSYYSYKDYEKRNYTEYNVRGTPIDVSVDEDYNIIREYYALEWEEEKHIKFVDEMTTEWSDVETNTHNDIEININEAKEELLGSDMRGSEE